MKKQLETLINASTGDRSSFVFLEFFAACCAWLKLTQEGKLDDEKAFKNDATLEQLLNVLNDCVSVHHHRILIADADNITQLMTGLTTLITHDVIDFQDLSDAIEELLVNSGSRFCTFSIPVELRDLAVALLQNKTDSVYCPFSGGYRFAQALPADSEKEGETADQMDAFLAEVQSMLLDTGFEVRNTDPVTHPSLIGDGGLKQFQSSVGFPPVGFKYSKEFQDIWARFPEKSLMGEVFQLRHMLAQTEERVVCFTSNGFLYRSAAGEKQFKEAMIEQKWLKAVIALPERLLENTQIPVSLLVFDKTKQDDSVLFIDASSEHFITKATRTQNKLLNLEQIVSLFTTAEESDFSKYCSPSEIKANDFNLWPGRYVLSQADEKLRALLDHHAVARLEELVDIIRPQAIKHDEEASETFIEHNLTSLNSVGQLTGSGKTIQVSSKDLTKANKQVIKPGDVLVSCRGAVGRIALVDSSTPDNTLASQAFAILRLKSHINTITSEALYQFLNCEYGQLQLSGLITGTKAQMLSAKDLSNIEIPLLPTEKLKQASVTRQKVLQIHETIQQQQQEIATLNESWLENV